MKDKETIKAERTISELEKSILETMPKEEGISESQRKFEAHITATELYSSELSYDE